MNEISLSERERECLQHLRRAEELGTSLREYAAAFDLKVQDLYQGKRQLSRKGALGNEPVAEGDFVAVRVASLLEKALLRLATPRAGSWCVMTGHR